MSKSKLKVTAAEIKAALGKRHRSRGDFYLTEVHSGPLIRGVKILDAVGIKKSWTKPCITGYEIKVSRSDFLNDSKWSSYLPLCHRFNFVCPKGLINIEDLPKGYGVGLIWYNPEKKSLYTKKKSLFKPIELNTDFLYYIIMSRLDSDRTPFYSDQKQYAIEYLKEKQENSLLGIQIGSKMANEINGLRREKNKWEHEQESIKADTLIYEKIKNILRNCGLEVPWIYVSNDGSIDERYIDRINKFCNKLEKCIKGNFNNELSKKIDTICNELNHIKDEI